MRALVVVHDPGSVATLVGERLEHHGFALEELVLTTIPGEGHSDVPFPDPTDFDLILPMGSTYSVYDEGAIGSWIGRELEFLRAADDASVPVFGICFGGQALASAHGGRTLPAETQQVGWFDIDSSRPDDIAPGPWMEWHYDRFEAPPDAEILAKDATCTQAFRLRKNLGVQFHPEVTRRHLQGWLDAGGYEELARLGVDPHRLLDETDICSAFSGPNTDRLVDWFLADVADLVPVG